MNVDKNQGVKPQFNVGKGVDKEVSPEKKKIEEQKAFLKELSRKRNTSGVQGKSEKKMEGRKAFQVKTLGYFERRRLANFHKQAEKAVSEYCKKVDLTNINRILMSGNLPKEFLKLESKFSKIDKSVMEGFFFKKIEEFAVDQYCMEASQVTVLKNKRNDVKGVTTEAMKSVFGGSDDGFKALENLDPLEIDFVQVALLMSEKDKQIPPLPKFLKQKIVNCLESKIRELSEKGKLHPNDKTQKPKNLGSYTEQYKKAQSALSMIAESDKSLKSQISKFKLDFQSETIIKNLDGLKNNWELDKLMGPEGKVVTNYHGLIKAEVKGLELLSRLEKGEKLDHYSSLFLGNFLKNAVGNKKLNGALRALDKGDVLPPNCSKDVIGFMVNFTFRSPMHKLALPHIGTLDQINKDIEDNKDPEKKLQLNEYHAILAFSKLAGSSKTLFEKIMGDKNILGAYKELNKLFLDAKKSSELVDSIEENFDKECNDNLTSRDILMEDLDLEGKFYKGIKKTEFWQWLCKIFVSRFGHAAKIYKEEIGGKMKTQLSHVIDEYQNDKLSFQTASYSRLFRMNVAPLISKEVIKKLQEKHGSGYKQELEKINQRFDELQKELHKKGANEINEGKEEEKKKFKGIENTWTRLYGAGLAKYSPMGHRSLFSPTKPEKVHEQFYMDGKAQKSEMICSEFVARTTVAALVQLNKELAQELGLQAPNDKIIDMPFGKLAKLKKIHPELLVRLLKRAGCLTEVPRLPILEKVFGK